MAKTDNLTDFLTDVANAIRKKKGTTRAINPQDFSSEIASIESGESGGGGGVVTSAPISDVNFLDYDGTILYSYTKEQFLALSAMPELPTREGLICQGWNYRWGEAVSYVTDYGKLNIGAMYITDDGDTRLYIRIATEGRMTVPLYWNQSVAKGVGIDWGDGSAIQTFTGTGNKNTTHTYAKHGDYVIRLKVVSGCTLGLGNSSSSYCVMGSTNASNRAYTNMLQKVEIGDRATNISNYAFYTCVSLGSVSIPSSITSIGNYAFNGCYALKAISIPSSVTSIGEYAFYICNSLISIGIPNSVISIGANAFYSCASIASVTLPYGIEILNDSIFYSCYSLSYISIPSSVTSIKSNVFGYCYSMAVYDFSKHTSVPALAAQTTFNRIPSDCVIKVPMSLLSDWESATNWSAFDIEIVGV